MATKNTKVTLRSLLKGRPEPSAVKAGQRPKSKSKYENGGRVARKKTV